jgi:hypothetical protein
MSAELTSKAVSIPAGRRTVKAFLPRRPMSHQEQARMAMGLEWSRGGGRKAIQPTGAAW